MKTTKEMRVLSNEELNNRLKEFKKELLKLNAERGNGAGANSGKIRKNKRNIARILTLLREREVIKE